MKTVLMVCKHFSPQNTVAAIRPTKLAKYLQRSGRYSVYVVYEDSAKAEFSDELLQKDREELSGVCALSPVYYTNYSRLPDDGFPACCTQKAKENRNMKIAHIC